MSTISSVSDKKIEPAVSEFKAPIAIPLRKKTKTVLDEEEYLHKMGEIIERDFYPDLRKLKAKVEYLEAVESNDAVKLRELYTKYKVGKNSSSTIASGLSSFVNTPQTFDTPEIPPINDDHSEEWEKESVINADTESIASSKNSLKDLNLDKYLAKTTSEDNDSFVSIMEEADRKHREKYAWLYNKETEHAKLAAQAAILPSFEQQALCTSVTVKTLDTWTYTNTNAVMYVPDGVELSAAEKQEVAKRAQKEVRYANTRFEGNPFDESANKQAIQQAAQVNALVKDGKIGVDGKELHQDGQTISETVLQITSLAGYGFVPATPDIHPGANETPLMTWGEIEGTPFRLDGSETPLRPMTPGGPQFHIADVPYRERLAMRLSDGINEKKRTKKADALKTMQAHLSSPSPRHVDRLSTMSPAAQQLAEARLRIQSASVKDLRASYHASPAMTPVHDASASQHKLTSGIRTKAGGVTPKLYLSEDRLRALSGKSSPRVRSGLRTKASDFFS